MGEAKRRKKLDPNYGKSVMIGSRTDLQWKKELRFTDREWQKVKPHFRVVNTIDDVDDTVDGLWIYDEDGEEMMGLTGRFIYYLSDESGNRIEKVITFI